MRKGRKILILVLAGMMALHLGGCSKKTPEEIYQEAAQNASELDSMAAATVIQLTLSQGEDTLDLSMNMEIEASGLTTGEFLYAAEGFLSFMEQEMDLSYFYADGYYYMDMMGAKLKYPMDLENMMDQAKQLMGGTSYDLEYIQNLEAQKEGDDTILTYTMDGQQLEQLVGELMDSVGAGEAALEGVKYTFNSVDCQMTVNLDGYNTASKINMDMSMTVGEETVGLVLDMTTEIENPGEPVEVAIPDTSDYQEVIGGAVGTISEIS